MKKFMFFLLTFVFTLNLSAQNTFVLPDMQKPHQIAVEGNDLYIFDEADYSLHVYTISPFALKSKIGKKGDGPHDFKYLPFVYVQPDTLACTDFTKTIWFSKDGKVLKVKEYTDLKDFDLNSEMLLFPIKKHYVRITADHDQQKRHVYLLNSEFGTIKELYEGPFTWKSNAPIHYRTDTFCYKDKIFISDTQKGFFISVFDDKGNHLRSIDKSQDIEKVSKHPLLHQYCVSNNKIYATTYKKKDNKTEMIVLDMKGRILRRLYLPLTSIQPKRGVLRYDLFVVDQEKLYEVIKKKDSDGWELLITDLDKYSDFHQNESALIKVPKGNGKPVLLDGIFSPGEWEDAKNININQNVTLFLKKYQDHVFIGIKITPYKTSVVDMFLSPDGKNIHHLHTSAQISERLVNENSGPWDNPSFIWGYSIDWYANEIRWDNGKMQDLMKKGKTRNEAQEMSYFKYDGFEFQIKQSKFSSDQWLFRIEVPIAPDFDKPIIFPSGTEMISTKGWIRLELE